MKLEDQVWRPIPGYEGLYEANADGLIRSLTRSGSNGKIIKQHLVKGYKQVWLSKNNKTTKLAVHRAVLMAFIRMPQKGEVCNHTDGDKTNNRLQNLEWTSRKENEWHKRNVLGYDAKDCRNGNWGYRHSKLYPSPELRNKLCSLGIPRSKHNLAELGEMLPIKNIQQITKCSGESKKWVILLPGAFADTEADARAKMLIYLIENKLMETPDA